MKKALALLLALGLAAAMLTGCGQTGGDSGSSASAAEDEYITIMINTIGLGQIAAGYPDTEITFDDEMPTQSMGCSLNKGDQYVLKAKADEGWYFQKWTKDGEDISVEAEITIEVDAPAEYVAYFELEESEESADTETEDSAAAEGEVPSFTTLGELMAADLPFYGASLNNTTYVYCYEVDGTVYRAICENIPEDIANEYFELNFADGDVEDQKNELISPLEISYTENLTEGFPEQEELDQMVGMTGGDLLDMGWIPMDYDLSAMEFTMFSGPYSYRVTFEEQIDSFDEFGDYSELVPLTIKDIICEGYGDMTGLN